MSRHLTRSMSPIIPSEARSVLENARRLFVVTGAGMSADSGVPTFRGESGLFGSSKNITAPVFDHDLRLRRQDVFDFVAQVREHAAAASPHAGYRVLAQHQAQLRSRGGDLTVVTMNVDDLHERAGLEALHLHGSAYEERCDTDRCTEGLVATGSASTCPVCQLQTRPSVVLYGERENVEASHFGKRALQRADAMLVIGVSGETERIQRWALDAQRDYLVPSVLWTLDPTASFASLFSHVVEAPADALVEIFG